MKTLVFCCILLFSLNSSKATHIVGGELNYECLGNDTYRVSLTVFRDCFNGAPGAYFDDPASIGIFDVNNNLVTSLGNNGQLLIPLMNDDTLDPTLFDSCLVVPPNVCVHRTTYTDVLVLPFVQGGYQLVYQRCCRNNTIQNIIAPEDTGATYYNFISEESLLGCNNSAVFKEWPPNYICQNEPILFDHGAIDIDGDSLVYSLCTPFSGATPDNPQPQPPNPPPYDDIVWLDPPYNQNNMMGGTPLFIDSETGFLTGTPNTEGQFVVGVCVEEYRDGVLISTTKRDFQYNVGRCGEAISSFFAPAVDCDGFTVNFDNQSEDAVDFLWDFGDLSTTLDVSTATNPSYTYPDTGLYEITMIAGPNELCADTSYSTVSVQIPSLFVDFDLSIIDGCVYPAQVSFDDLSFDTISTIVDWDWQFSNGDTSDLENPIWYVTQNGTFSATLTATAANGCQVSHTDFISISVLELGLQDTANICIDESIILNPGTDPSYTYNWSDGATLSSTTSPSPQATPLATTTYYVTVEDNDGCIYNDSIEVVVTDLVVDFEDDLDICLGDTISLHDGTEPDLTYSWTPNINIIDPNTGTASAHPEAGIVYYVNVVNDFGCDYQDSIILTPIINEELTPSFVICDGESAALNPNPNLDYSYTWTPAGTLDNPTSPNPIATPDETTVYTVEILDNPTGCTSMEQVILSVDPLPSIPNDSIEACRNVAEPLNPGANTIFNYTWSPTTGLDNPIAPNPNVTMTSNGNTTYYVTIVNPTTLCEYFDSINVFVPIDVTVLASDDEVVCETSLDISAATNTGQTLEWFDDSNLTNSIGTGETIEVNPGVSSTYYVVATDEYGCTVVDDVMVGSQAVDVDVPAQINICEDNSFSIEAVNLKPDDILTYEWIPDSVILNGANSSNPTFLLDEDDVLTLVVENQYGCFDTLFIPVDVIPNDLGIVATADPDSIYPGESSQLNATQQGNYVYQWTSGELLDNDMIDNPIATPPETTTFNVFVESDIGCKDTTSVTVYMKTFFCDAPYIFVPNAFTPDNDGMNDVFYVRGNAVDEMFMAVYNRWGEKIFETTDLDAGWDGTYKGKELAPDVYGYYLQLRCLNGEEYFTKGNVTLIR